MNNTCATHACVIRQIKERHRFLRAWFGRELGPILVILAEKNTMPEGCHMRFPTALSNRYVTDAVETESTNQRAPFHLNILTFV